MSKKPLKLGICGASGRMGKVIIQCCQDMENAQITAAIEAKHSPLLGKDAGVQAGIGNIQVSITDEIAKVANDFDLLIDFSIPEAIEDNVQQCCAQKRKMVIGTTSLSVEQNEAIQEAAQSIAILYSPNMSVGVNLCFALLQQAARGVGDEADIDIIDFHHKGKRDAPSGTALKMGEIIAKELEIDLGSAEQLRGISPRLQRIAFEAIRAGDLAGEHQVLFTLPDEQITISHKATSRYIFARGAIRAAIWLQNKASGFYDMQDVLK